MKHSETIGEVAKALSKAQGQFNPAIKDGVNPHFRSTYATLDSIWKEVRKPLSDNGLAVIQGTTETGNDSTICVTTMLVHTSGEWISSDVTLPVTKKDAQGIGSALTYGQRYGLRSIVGITTGEDDDGNAAVASAPPVSAQAPKPLGVPASGVEKAELIAQINTACKEINAISAEDAPKWKPSLIVEFIHSISSEKAQKIEGFSLKTLHIAKNDLSEKLKELQEATAEREAIQEESAKSEGEQK